MKCYPVFIALAFAVSLNAQFSVGLDISSDVVILRPDEADALGRGYSLGAILAYDFGRKWGRVHFRSSYQRAGGLLAQRLSPVERVFVDVEFATLSGYGAWANEIGWTGIIFKRWPRLNYGGGIGAVVPIFARGDYLYRTLSINDEDIVSNFKVRDLRSVYLSFVSQIGYDLLPVLTAYVAFDAGIGSFGRLIPNDDQDRHWVNGLMVIRFGVRARLFGNGKQGD